MKWKVYNILPIILALLCTGCNDTTVDERLDSDMVRVDLTIGGTYGAPFSDLGTRADEDYQRDLGDFTPVELPEGSTLWVHITNVTNPTNPQVVAVKSYVVRNKALYPCEVNDEGVLTYETNSPLFLKRGDTYIFRAMGSARKLNKRDNNDYSLYIRNGEYVYANDNRYPQTVDTEATIPQESSKAFSIELKPLIHQTAQLKFTLESEEIPITGENGEPVFYDNDDDQRRIFEDGGTWYYALLDENGNIVRNSEGNLQRGEVFSGSGVQQFYYPVHNLDVTSSGVVITGLQREYDLAQGGIPWNWTVNEHRYLETFPGDVNNYYTIYQPKENTQHRIVFETAILPTDAVATPIIVGFYLRVNEVPTQFEMMLNRKMFVHAYSYHYKGKIKIEGGVSVLEWQTITGDVVTTIPVID